MNKKSIVALILAFAVVFSTMSTSLVFAETGYLTDTLIELESCSHSGMNTRIVKSKYSSGGMYIVNTSGNITAPENIVTDDISLMVNIPNDLNTRVFVRVQFPSGSANSFYWRWDNSPWQTFTGTYAKDFQWVELTRTNISNGLHKFSLCRKMSGVCFDAIYITQDEEYVPSTPEGVEVMPEEERVITQTQASVPSVDKTGIVVEAEDMTFDASMSIVADKAASGGRALKVSNPTRSTSTPPTPDVPGSAEYEFTASEDGSLFIWARFYAPNVGSDSAYTAMDGEQYINRAFSAQSDYFWYNAIERVDVKKGETYKFRFHYRENNLRIDQLVITGLVSFTPTDIVKGIDAGSTVLEQMYELPPVNPPAGEHPRVYFRASDREELIYKLNHPENAQFKTTFDRYVNNPVNIGTAYADTVLATIESKAYYYALYGDEKVGREAIDAALSAMATWPPLIGDIEGHTRHNGRIITSLSLVYDWCYDLLTEEEKNTIIDQCISCATIMENGWPPVKQEAIVGHAAEAQLLRDVMSFAIATYDERPDIWNFVGGRFYEEFVPVRLWYMPSGIHHQGANYGIYRHSWDLHVYALITGMGAPEPYPAKDVAGMDYSRMIYLRRPDGLITLDGDMYNTVPMEYAHPSETNLVLSSSIAMDPYLKDEYVRVSYESTKNGITRAWGSNLDADMVIHLIFSEPDLERKSIDNLPLSKFFGSPMGTMAARTGWGDGVTDDSVVAQMKMDEYWFGNHQTPAAGHFAIYYKGPLTGQGGVYDIYGSPAFNHYNHHTTASNCILVYDPNEPEENFDSKGNDGGQMRHLNTRVSTFEEFFTRESEFRKNIVEGQEIDPEDATNPDYTYLKGDLTNSYSDKITDYTRSLMFLNLKDDTFPAAMVVFDKVSVKDPTFKKTWLLHGQSYPQFEKNRTVWLSSPYENDLGEKYIGKMINDSLLPADDKVTKTVIGSEEDGWNIVNGVNVPGNTQNGKDREENTYRLEISPTENNETEYFFNVIQVTDEGNTSYLSTELLESKDFYGTVISDRAVFFSKSGDRVGESIEVEAPDGNYKYTICDVESGTWQVTSSLGTQSVVVSEEGGVLAFDAPGGKITAVKTSDEAENLLADVHINGDRKTLYIKCNNEFVNQPVESELINGRYMVAIDHLAAKMGLKERKEFMKNIYTDEVQKLTAEVRYGSGVISVNGVERKLDNPSYFKDGHLMIELRSFAEAFNYEVFYDSIQNMILMSENPQIVREIPEGYVEIVAVTGNVGVQEIETYSSANVIDGLTSTQWAAQGIGSYFDIELKEEVLLENIEIIFAPNSRRTPDFEIQISSDGKTYETIYTGKGDPDCDGKNFEVFLFDRQKEFRTKYVRYVGNGSDKSLWNGVREIRFKIAEPIIRWEEKSEYAPVAGITYDGGEIAHKNRWENVNDNNSRTIWAAQGTGRYIQFELQEPTSLKGINVMFNPNSNRTAVFEVQISDDGVNFESVFKGNSDPASKEFTWEEFDFGKTVTAKYVRYVGLGSNISAWNGVNEIRFIKE